MSFKKTAKYTLTYAGPYAAEKYASHLKVHFVFLQLIRPLFVIRHDAITIFHLSIVVWSLGLIIIAINSCNSSLQAYGILIQQMSSAESHLRQWYLNSSRLASQKSPQALHTWTRQQSETSKRRSFRKRAAPCEIIQSRSISPKRRPPSLALPSVGCLVRIYVGPLPREWILSATKCFRRWQYVGLRKIITSNRFPVNPLYITSFPYLW